MITRTVDEVFGNSYPLKVALIGSGNWGSAIARVIGNNVLTNYRFQNEIQMFVHAEKVKGESLATLINERHENVRYLPGFSLPKNIIANEDLIEVVSSADILVFVLPHQFVESVCLSIHKSVKPNAIALSLIKGFIESDSKQLVMASTLIEQILNVPCDTLMGANIATEVAQGDFCEATLGCRSFSRGILLKSFLASSRFHINVVKNRNGVEICGAVKNIIATAAGILLGLEQGYNSVGSVIQIGLKEMIHLLKHMCPNYDNSVVFESCGLADIIASADGGRNSRIAAEFVRSGKELDDLEREMLNGQKLQGPMTATILFDYLEANDLDEEFPLFTTVYRICTRKAKAVG
ncbi:hypothetical protein ACOME3_002051 [Neoechinorhynchus agilis]